MPIGRSENMRRIRSRNTTPEVAVRSYLHAAGFRYRLHGRTLVGKPDIVFPGHRVAVFVHGCFWHQHKGCKDASTPKTHSDYWSPKLASNVARDARNLAALRSDGWSVMVIWECETKRPECLAALAKAIDAARERGKARAGSPVP
jgi:DNA mismatch endonuclease (patch repair protein)